MSKKRNTQVLCRQRIDAGGPGSILRDFETLLEFIGPDGVLRGGEVPFSAHRTAGRTGREDEQPLAAAPGTPAATVLPAYRRAVSLAPRHAPGCAQGHGQEDRHAGPRSGHARPVADDECDGALLQPPGSLVAPRPSEKCSANGGGWMASMLWALREIWQRVAIYRAAGKRLWRCPGLRAGFLLLPRPRRVVRPAGRHARRACRGRELADPRCSPYRIR